MTTPSPAADVRLPALAVLVSGGLDSAILLGESLHNYAAVYPLYVSSGLYWEPVELEYLHRFLHAVRSSALQTLHILEMPVADLYGQHWSLTGVGVPHAETPDEAVFLPGRNVLLLAKAILWCHLHGVGAVALAPLDSNPFPDATPAFFEAYQTVVNQAIGGNVRVLRPYQVFSKADVLRRGQGLPLEHTFSCMRPMRGLHCAHCNKCAERRRGFTAAGLPDPTTYALEGPCSA